MYCRKWAEQNRMGSQTRQTDKNLANELSISLLLSSMRNIIIMFPEAFGNCFMKNRKRNSKLYSPNACIQSIQSHRLHFYLNIASNGILFLFTLTKTSIRMTANEYIYKHTALIYALSTHL